MEEYMDNLKYKVMLYIYQLILCGHNDKLTRDKYEQVVASFSDEGFKHSISEHVYESAIAICHEKGIDVNNNRHAALQELFNILTYDFCLDTAYEYITNLPKKDNQVPESGGRK